MTSPAAPREVLLHVGHGKTGSSFLQSALANSIEELASHGIAYPMAAEERERVRAGGISSGNMGPAPARLVQLLKGDWTGGATVPVDRLLLSSESHFNKMRPKGFMDRLQRRLPGTSIRVMLYIRDPLDHAVSNYQQAVKRGGYTGDFASFLDDYVIPGNVSAFLAWLGELDNVDVTVRNYSRHKTTLAQTFEDWMGIPDGTLCPPAVTQVNRSMTNAEIALQRAFSDARGWATAKFISDPLCEHLPDVRSERPAAPPEALERFLSRMHGLIVRRGLERHLPEGEHYHLPSLEEALAQFPAPDPAPVHQFSEAQLRVLVAAISEEIRQATDGGGVLQQEAKRVAGMTGRKMGRKHQPGV